MHWYALECTSSKTFAVRDDLKRDGFEAYTPWYFDKKHKFVKSELPDGRMVKKKTWPKVQCPLIPGYVFVRLASLPSVANVLDADHVRGAVSFGGPAIKIPDKAMRRVMDLTPAEIDKAMEGRRLTPGARAEIVEGPMAGNLVHIASIKGDRAKVVFDEIFASVVDVPMDILENVA